MQDMSRDGEVSVMKSACSLQHTVSNCLEKDGVSKQGAALIAKAFESITMDDVLMSRMRSHVERVMESAELREPEPPLGYVPREFIGEPTPAMESLCHELAMLVERVIGQPMNLLLSLLFPDKATGAPHALHSGDGASNVPFICVFLAAVYVYEERTSIFEAHQGDLFVYACKLVSGAVDM
eukprot:TRINITY_DN18438_c0_g1_i1.p1 TRINITY_DN18438_c0_g1~~TRINITY_DN18438_c0_g1_i1.p1  ORF type:complete len:203 (+),score=68.65 TRINITY_DN18438_c0_g1_i1:68-610(+)